MKKMMLVLTLMLAAIVVTFTLPVNVVIACDDIIAPNPDVDIGSPQMTQPQLQSQLEIKPIKENIVDLMDTGLASEIDPGILVDVGWAWQESATLYNNHPNYNLNTETFYATMTTAEYATKKHTGISLSATLLLNYNFFSEVPVATSQDSQSNKSSICYEGTLQREFYAMDYPLKGPNCNLESQTNIIV